MDMNIQTEKQKNTRPSIKSILTLSVFILIVGGAFLLNLIMPKPDVLQSERRKPAAFPKLSADTLISSDFMDGFGKYATDNFVFRDTWRAIRAVSVFDLFRQADKSGIYIDDNVGVGKFEKIDEKSVRKVAQKIKYICGLFPGLDIYYSVVPDKSVYATKYFPGFDFKRAYEILSEELTGIKFIGLTDSLSGEYFYRTDIHWDQACISGVVETLGNAMGFQENTGIDFNLKFAGEFHGVYTGQIALPLKPDLMAYLTNDILDNATVSYFNPAAEQQWEEGPMYNVAAINGRDPYDLFLGGVQPLITIENPAADTSRQLYLFRDSFGSSLAPLLIPAYAKITIIDVRYIDVRVLGDYIAFAQSDADVLFLYSSQILNTSEILRAEIN